MFMSKKLLAILIAVLASLTAYYIDNKKAKEIVNLNIKEKEKFLSENAREWLRKGNFFTYNSKYKIFYILEKINDVSKNIEEKSSASVQNGDLVNVFLHGCPRSSFDFKKIWDQFLSSKERKSNSNQYLLSFDYLGYGFSDKPLDYTYSIFVKADMIERIFLQLNINNINLIETFLFFKNVSLNVVFDY